MKSLAAALFTALIVSSAHAAAWAEDPSSTHWDRPAEATSGGVTTADLYPESCGRCHPDQFRDWSGSLHRRSVGPGLTGQLRPQEDPGFAASCYYCHAPLVEQAELGASDEGFAENPLFDAKLKGSGVSCAACHARKGVVYGPRAPRNVPKADGEGHASVKGAFFSQADFCAACHQLDKGFRFNGTPLTNTYREWEGSPFAKAGVPCQGCHMPGRRHLFRGIHDPEMTRSGVEIESGLLPGGKGEVSAHLAIRNTGAGHMLPTYVTPSIVVRGFFIGAGGEAIPGTAEEKTIGRRVAVDLSRELFDTRIPTGGAFRFDYRRQRPGDAVGIVFEVWVHPDEFYNRFFGAMLSGAGPGQRPLLARARKATEASVYLLYREELPLDE
ncbi:MAG: multiheme c-type cytochrome [Thermodesulfobacteriota bacterium]